ncbi:hypothetical protein PARMER_03954 [Parabacteroides merdae ATCC 43184]|nr:hypothetical protein PARMER_03954 [Parabacteroides merdae ATCC 43184]
MQSIYVLKSNHRCFENRCLSLPKTVDIRCQTDTDRFFTTL